MKNPIHHLVAAAAALLFALPTIHGAEPFDLPLYDGPAPGAPASPDAEVFVKREGNPISIVTHVQTPDLRVYLPEKGKATGAAIVICPGGAYRVLAIDHEGWQIAQWLAEGGVAAIVCKYRVSDKVGPAYQHPVPLLDARQAVRQTRAHAAEWGIDPQRVGIMGFSAGGHLASTALTMFDQKLPGEDEAAFAKMEHKPDFGVLVYPVISMHEKWGHAGSANFLLGDKTTPEERQKFSTDLLVTEKTPPTFLVSSKEDTGVPPQNSIAFYQAMLAHNVPGELHVWEKGPHGFGILEGRGRVAREWPSQLLGWMEERGLLKKTP